MAEMQQHFIDNRREDAERCAKSVSFYDMPLRKLSARDGKRRDIHISRKQARRR